MSQRWLTLMEDSVAGASYIPYNIFNNVRSLEVFNKNSSDRELRMAKSWHF